MKQAYALLVSFFVVFSSIHGADTGLLLHLALNEGSGAIAKDSSGRGHDAKLVNAQWEQFGIEGKALRLNGKDAYVDLPQHQDFDNLKNFTMSIWLKVEKYDGGLSLFTRGNYNTGWSTYIFRSFVLLTGRSLKRSAILYNSFPAAPEPIKPFTHIVITGEPSAQDASKMTVKFYRDGKQLTGRGNISEFTVDAFLPSPKSPISIGKYGSASNLWYNGLIDDIKIFSRTLSPEEIASEYSKTKAAGIAAQNSLPPMELKPVNFQPLKKNRLAIYDIPAEYGIKPIQPIEWFETQANANGLKATRLNNSQIGDSRILNTRNFDTLLLPVSIMPLECEDSIFKFLAQGGNLLTTSIVPSTFNLDETGKPLRDETGKIIFKSHGRGWFAPFLVRHLDPGWGWATRSVTNPLNLNPGIAEITGDFLPARFEADSKIRYTPADCWNTMPNGDGGYGEGTNYAQNGDILTGIYNENNGVVSDFIAYRYYNNLIFGSTFVEFGKIGSKLLTSENGAKVFRAALQILESKLPGEQDKSYYKDLVSLHKLWSDYEHLFFDSISALRDAAIYKNLSGSSHGAINDTIDAIEKSYASLRTKRKAQMLVSCGPKDPKAASIATKQLISLVTAEMETCKTAINFASLTTKEARPPAPVSVKHKYGIIPSIASQVFPTNLNRMRGRMFQTMRDIGINVYSGAFHNWYAADQQTRDNFGDMQRDFKFVYMSGARVITGGGIFNPAKGTVKDAPAIQYPTEKLHTHLDSLMSNWKWHSDKLFRIGTGDETGLGFQYWGSEPAEEFRTSLRTFFKDDINALNAHCNSNYKDFAQIQLPLRQPATPAEHAIWEFWRQARENKLETIHKNFYKEVKAVNPNLDVFQLPSTGALNSPVYGVNYYNVTKCQDVSGIDGTCCGINEEWIYSDITTKRYLTSEWGGLYSEQPPTYINAKLWEELTVGALGFEQHVWNFGGSAISFVDTLDIPTVYGNLLRMTIRDARKINHVILDGKRATPDIALLFSQTARVHDQSWGWNGEKITSKHLLAMTNFYDLFLDFQRSARAVAEESILDGNMPESPVMIAPQTRFLSNQLQEKLIEYAQNGGILILEGRCGEFDNFGRKSDLLFQKIGVVPAFTESRELTIGGVTLDIPAEDSVFSPVGNGEVLAYFGKEPAAVSVTCGKGKVVVLGFNPGLCRYTAFPAIFEHILGKLNVTQRFIVSNPAFLLREWKHGDDTYLLMTYRAPHWKLEEATVSVRGKLTIEDYLFGTNVTSTYKDGYTEFKTLLSNGARIFRIKGGSPAGLDFAEARAHEPKTRLAADKKDSAGVKDTAKTVSLPFKGSLYDTAPIKAGNFTFALTTVATGSNANIGETYLTITSGKETQRKRIMLNKDYYFRMRKQIFKVHSTKNFYMYPFFSDLSIEEVSAMPPSQDIEVKENNTEVTFNNGLLDFTVSKSKGASIKSLKPVDDQSQQIHSSERCFAVTGAMPGPFSDQPFNMAITEKSPELCTASFTMSSPIANKSLTQNITMSRETAGFSVRLACTNTDNTTKKFDLRWHPELNIGSAADQADNFVIPVEDGIKNILYQPVNNGYRLKPASNWAAVVDTAQKLAYITEFKPEQVNMVYIWEGTGFYSLEIFAPASNVAPKESLPLDLNFFLLRGLSGIDAWNNGYAAFIAIPEFVNQNKDIPFTLQIASAYAKATSVKAECSVWKDGKLCKNVAAVTDDIAFDLPMDSPAHLNLAGLPDGIYELKSTVTCGSQQPFTATKKIKLAGNELALLSKAYDEGCIALDKLKNITPEKRFAIRVMLENIKMAASRADFNTAQKALDDFRDAMNQ